MTGEFPPQRASNTESVAFDDAQTHSIARLPNAMIKIYEIKLLKKFTIMRTNHRQIGCLIKNLVRSGKKEKFKAQQYLAILDKHMCMHVM